MPVVTHSGRTSTAGQVLPATRSQRGAACRQAVCRCGQTLRVLPVPAVISCLEADQEQEFAEPLARYVLHVGRAAACPAPPGGLTG